MTVPQTTAIWFLNQGPVNREESWEFHKELVLKHTRTGGSGSRRGQVSHRTIREWVFSGDTQFDDYNVCPSPGTHLADLC